MSYLQGYFRDFLIAERERKGLSAADVCRISGIKQSNYSQFESGKRRFSFATLEKILDALDVDIIVAEANQPFLMLKGDK